MEQILTVRDKDYLIYRCKGVEIKVHRSGSIYLNQPSEDVETEDRLYRNIFRTKRKEIIDYVGGESEKR